MTRVYFPNSSDTATFAYLAALSIWLHFASSSSGMSGVMSTPRKSRSKHIAQKLKRPISTSYGSFIDATISASLKYSESREWGSRSARLRESMTSSASLLKSYGNGEFRYSLLYLLPARYDTSRSGSRLDSSSVKFAMLMMQRE